ncbi:MAG: hypothetical protein JOZ41_12575, partial [Chloroflexi bacterium]|nr:hypothetical protein [Chloroflexota bacterium]
MISAACALGGTALAPLLSVALRNPAIGFILVACMVLAVGLVVWIWQQPVRGVYVLFGAAVLL